MKKILILICLIKLISCSLRENLSPPIYNTSTPAKQYYLNLSQSPLEMWREVVTDYKQVVAPFVKQFSDMIFKTFPTDFAEFIANDSWKNNWDPQFIEEIEAIAYWLDLSSETLFIYNFMYNYYAACTSIVIQNQEGHMLFGRNLDYMTILNEMVVEGIFIKNGEIQYKSALLIGFAGLTTVYKPKAFAISLNQRDHESIGNFNATYQEIQNLLQLNYQAIMTNKRWQVIWLIRKTAENCPDYECAKTQLEQAELDGPSYLILGGSQPNQGVIIERNLTTIHFLYFMQSQLKSHWYIAQTNYDRDIPDPSDDPRRTAAEKYLEDVGWSITNQSLFDEVMVKYPVRNRITIFTFLVDLTEDAFSLVYWAKSNNQN